MATNKTIYLIRHGQTDYNLKGIVQGSGIDSDLNQHGISQAQAFYTHYKHIRFDHVYTSSLKRTVQSVDRFIQSGIPFTRLSELNEINWGVFEGQETTRESRMQFDEVIHAWRNGELQRPIKGGESPNELYDRQLRGWDKIKTDEHETILICMHGRAMRSFLSLILATPLREMDIYPHANLCLYVIEINDEGKSLVLKNDVMHLESIPS